MPCARSPRLARKQCERRAFIAQKGFLLLLFFAVSCEVCCRCSLRGCRPPNGPERVPPLPSARRSPDRLFFSLTRRDSVFSEIIHEVLCLDPSTEDPRAFLAGPAFWVQHEFQRSTSAILLLRKRKTCTPLCVLRRAFLPAGYGGRSVHAAQGPSAPGRGARIRARDGSKLGCLSRRSLSQGGDGVHTQVPPRRLSHTPD